MLATVLSTGDLVLYLKDVGASTFRIAQFSQADGHLVRSWPMAANSATTTLINFWPAPEGGFGFLEARTSDGGVPYTVFRAEYPSARWERALDADQVLNVQGFDVTGALWVGVDSSNSSAIRVVDGGSQPWPAQLRAAHVRGMLAPGENLVFLTDEPVDGPRLQGFSLDGVSQWSRPIAVRDTCSFCKAHYELAPLRAGQTAVRGYVSGLFADAGTIDFGCGPLMHGVTMIGRGGECAWSVLEVGNLAPVGLGEHALQVTTSSLGHHVYAVDGGALLREFSAETQLASSALSAQAYLYSSHVEADGGVNSLVQRLE